METAADGREGKRLFTFWARIPLFWRFQLAGWATYFLLSFPVKIAIFGSIQAAVVISIIRDGPAFVLTLGMRHIYQKVHRSSPSMKWVAVTVAAVSSAAGLSMTALSILYAVKLGLPQEHAILGLSTIRLGYFCMSMFFCWSLLYFGIRAMQDAADQKLRLAAAEAALGRAELQMLRAQMNPHFLFNALNTIKAGLGEHARELIPAIDGLSGFLRYSLAHHRSEFIPLKDEFTALEDYLEVEKARFGNDLEVNCHLQEAASNIAVPGVLLQPLVENAVKHGRATSPIPLRIHIEATLENNILQIEVANTGEWVPSQPSEQVGGVGFRNLRDRLSLLYPGTHSLDLHIAGGRVNVRIRIPATKTP